LQFHRSRETTSIDASPEWNTISQFDFRLSFHWSLLGGYPDLRNPRRERGASVATDLGQRSLKLCDCPTTDGDRPAAPSGMENVTTHHLISI
jgi:hypothetical protein